jgi:hypothetical protein
VIRNLRAATTADLVLALIAYIRGMEIKGLKQASYRGEVVFE